MRWLEFLALADGDPAAQQLVLDTALAALRQTPDGRLHASIVSAVPTLRSLCQSLDDSGIVVADELAQKLGVFSLGVEAAWLAEQAPRGGPMDEIAA